MQQVHRQTDAHSQYERVFVGEKRSRRAIELGLHWRDGRLAAKTLFDALSHCGIDPTRQLFISVFPESDGYVPDPTALSLIGHMARTGVQIIALGRRVQRALEAVDIPHARMVHPAARGAIRSRECYRARRIGTPWKGAGGGRVSTPIRQQYLRLKQQYRDTILFIKLGDFYETFDEDARVVAGELDIVLTAREVRGQRIPMAGVPCHSVEPYMARLIGRGRRVAVCEPGGEVRAVQQGEGSSRIAGSTAPASAYHRPPNREESQQSATGGDRSPGLGIESQDRRLPQQALPTIQVSGFGASTDGYAISPDPSRPWNPHACHLWYVSLLGPQEAIRAIWARLLKGEEATITDEALGRAHWVSLAPEEKKSWRWTQASLPRAAGHHGLLLPELAFYTTERPDFLLIPKEGREQALFYRFLNRRMNVPLDPGWSGWLWERALGVGELVALDGFGPRAYLCRSDVQTLRADLSTAIRTGVLAVAEGQTEAFTDKAA